MPAIYTIERKGHPYSGLRYDIKLNGHRIGEADFDIRMVSFGTDKQTAEIHFFGLDEPYQGKGHARKAWEVLERILKKRGAKRVFIYDYEDAWGFWQAMGFDGDYKRLS